MKDLDDFIIAIAGLGLIGGSLAMALKQNRVGRAIRGTDAAADVVTQALARGVIDAPCENFADVDWVILAMPVRSIITWLHAHGARLPHACMLMDCGSTKQAIVAAMNELNVASIGGHPMCGKETSGLAAADAQLFRDAKFVLTPTARTTEPLTTVAHSLARRIGAQPLVVGAAAHDRAVAAISHLPYVLSTCLVNTVADLHDAHASSLAASGYAGMTRLAASDPHMMRDIIATNRTNILAVIDAYQNELAALREAIAVADEAPWQAALDRAKNLKREKPNAG